MRKNIFYFYHLTTSPECAILYALTPKKLSRFCLQRKRSSSQSLRRWPLLLFLKSFNYISFFSFVNRSFPKKYFLFSLLTRRVKVYIMYSVCFYLDCLSLSQMVNKKADLLLKVDLFLLQNLPIIARSLSGSIPKI